MFQTPISAASSARFSGQPLFIINSLGIGMSLYANTKGSRVRVLGYPAEGERLRHVTTARSKRSMYRQPNKEVPTNQGIVSIWSSCSTWTPGYWREEIQDEYEASECDLLIID